jgi:hypothetical protein
MAAPAPALPVVQNLPGFVRVEDATGFIALTGMCGVLITFAGGATLVIVQAVVFGVGPAVGTQYDISDPPANTYQLMARPYLGNVGNLYLFQ